MSMIFNKFILLFLAISVTSALPCYSQSYDEMLRNSVVRYASNYMGTPYCLGHSSPNAFDCSGFTSYVYRNFGYNLYRTANSQIKNVSKIIKKTELKPADLVFFKGRNAKQNRIGHVGMVVEADGYGNFKFIHASVKYGVTITDGGKDYYRTRFVAAGRIIPEQIEQLKLLELLEQLEPLLDSLNNVKTSELVHPKILHF